MEKMLFTSPQPEIAVVLLPDGKRDITVLGNEEIVILENLSEECEKTMMFQYDGNQFRTVHELTEEDILYEKEKYLNYNSEEEPTLEQLHHDNEIIDSYTLELLEGGLL